MDSFIEYVLAPLFALVVVFLAGTALAAGVVWAIEWWAARIG